MRVQLHLSVELGFGFYWVRVSFFFHSTVIFVLFLSELTGLEIHSPGSTLLASVCSYVSVCSPFGAPVNSTKFKFTSNNSLEYYQEGVLDVINRIKEDFNNLISCILNNETILPVPLPTSKIKLLLVGEVLFIILPT